MGSNNHTPVEINPQTLQDSQKLWSFFTKATTVTVVLAAAVLSLMALFLL